MKRRTGKPKLPIGPAHVELGQFLRTLRQDADRSTRQIALTSGYVSLVENGKAHPSEDAIEKWLACVLPENIREMRRHLRKLHADATTESETAKDRKKRAALPAPTEATDRSSTSAQQAASGLASLYTHDPSLRLGSVEVTAVIHKDHDDAVWQWTATRFLITFLNDARHRLEVMLTEAVSGQALASLPEVRPELAYPWDWNAASTPGDHQDGVWSLTYPPTGAMPEPLDLLIIHPPVPCVGAKATLALDLTGMPAFSNRHVYLAFENTILPDIQNRFRPHGQAESVPIVEWAHRLFVVSAQREVIRFEYEWDPLTGKSKIANSADACFLGQLVRKQI